MFTGILSLILAGVLRLRYSIRIHGLEKLKRLPGKGILFLPNHPALIDPAIISSILVHRFHPWILINDAQLELTKLKYFVKLLKLLPVPDLAVTGRQGLDRVQDTFKSCAAALNAGENVLMYPSGHTYRSRLEDLKGNYGVHMLLEQAPDIRVVIIRTVGLWGSSFSNSSGDKANFLQAAFSHIGDLLKNLIFFGPRRHVDITICEPEDLPRGGAKEELNRYLEKFYNAEAPFNTYVPYTWFESGGTRIIAEPEPVDSEADTAEVPPEIREKVLAKLRETASVSKISDQDRLGADLGMDSLMVFELSVWIQEEFGQEVSSPDLLRRAGDVMLGAMGKKCKAAALNPVPPHWFLPEDDRILTTPSGCTKVTEAFLKLAEERPDFPLLADQKSGVLTNSKLILAILALKGAFEKLPGDRVGIIMPACAPFFVVYMAVLFAGKIPVLLNWTVGPRNLESCTRRSGVQAILSSKLVIEGLESHGIDFSSIKEKIVYLEDIKKTLSAGTKLLALLRSKFCWRTLRRANVPETTAILFTSGSESEPKIVPLTHLNCMADVKYAIKPVKMRKDDCILGMLPPFHSFGLLIGIMMPALTNTRIVFHANPTEGALLGKLIAAYRATFIVGTPTFAEGILSRTSAEELNSLRIVVTGAEKCPPRILDLCRTKCPQASFLEGYGITECGPIVGLNSPGAIKKDSVGHILECLEWEIRDESGNPLPPNHTGMLYVSGASVFNGYLAYDGPSPFEEKDGKKWYRTGDLVEADEAGFITFKGRLKRFIKVAGEMVSLPAVEEVLLERYKDKAEGIPLAIEASGSDSDPEIVLFSTFEIGRDEINAAIREAGFSPIHYVKRVVKIDAIPLLGSGKTDYRKLKSMI